MGPLIPMFWTSGDVSPGFQSQGGSLACVFRHLRTMDPSSVLDISGMLLELFGSNVKCFCF